MSPAILTETVWALASEGVIPARVIAVTTAAGRSRLETLFVPQPDLGGLCPWDALREHLEREGHAISGKLRFGATPDDIRVICALDPATGRSRELDDIRTPSDSAAAADFLLEHVRGITANPDTALIASIAGGRKTMGALLYGAISLLGRTGDRVTHVLVNDPFESSQGFWFPGQPDTRGTGPSSRGAVVQLADLPFVPLRDRIVERLGRHPGGFSSLVALCSGKLDARPELTLSPARPGCRVGTRSIPLAAREHSLLLLLAKRAAENLPVIADYTSAADEWNAFRADLRKQCEPSDFGDWRHSCGTEVTADDVKHDLSSLRAKFRRAGPEGIALANLLPRRGHFALDLPPSQIDLSG